MKKIIIFSVILGMMVATAGVVVAGNQTQTQTQAENGLSHREKVSQLYLYEKDPATWEIVEDGAWGKMMYSENAFVFNGHGLEAGVDYTLIYYLDLWLGNGLICLANGTTNNGGNINLKDRFDFTSIPIASDTNDGAKIWLVLSDDVDCENQKMTSWDPTEYLFENNLINEDSESASYTKYHGNGIYSTTHIVRKDNARPDKAPKKSATKGPACYKLMGVAWPETPNYVATSSDLLGIATTSIGTWNDETNFGLLGNGDVNEHAGFGDVYNPVMDTFNSYSYGEYPTAGVIAVCRTWYNPYAGEILEYDIMFDTDFTWGDATDLNTLDVMDLQNIATHEIGHGLGLLDVYKKPCGDVTMFGYSGEGDIEKRTLEPQDIAGLQSIYGN